MDQGPPLEDSPNNYVQLRSGGLVRYLIEDMVSALLGWIPTHLGLTLRWLFYRLLVKGSGLMAIERRVAIFGTRWMEIGSNVFLGEGVYLQGRPDLLKIGDRVRIHNGSLINVDNCRGLENSGIEIGNGVMIGMGVIMLGHGRLRIGEDVIIGPGVRIMPVNHNFAETGQAIKFQGIVAKGIEIKKGAWLGAGALILDGVTIGENAVVGAGSVVTADVPDRAVVVGNPARIVKN